MQCDEREPRDDSREHRLPVTGKRRGMQVVVGRGKSREYILTNKEKAYFAGETGTANTRSYEGLIVELHKFLEGWDLVLGGAALSTLGVRTACVLPQSMTREYIVEKTTETVFLADGENLLIVSYSSNYRGEASFLPRFDIRSIWEEGRPDYEVVWDESSRVLALSRSDHGERTPEEDWPVWVAIACDRDVEFVAEAGYRETTYTKDAARRAMGTAVPFVPGRLAFSFEGDEMFAAGVTFCVAVGDTLEEASSKARSAIENEFALYDAKMRRVSDMLAEGGVACRDNDYRYALAWATTSCDALIMNMLGRGIFAGLHWFPNYWGRDTFICLPGACLVRGEFDVSARILETFAGLQQDDERSPHYGRIPNLAMPGEIYFNTADGTWWFVRAVFEHLRYTGDSEFARRIFPAVRTAIEGELAKRVGPDGLSLHGNAETWMDAGGEGNPHSPRGDRAVEVQALWYEALEGGSKLAARLNEDDLARKWGEAASGVAATFRRLYWDEDGRRLYDHLDPDGTPDVKNRPNETFALTVPTTPLVTPEMAAAVVDHVARTCVLPHGVASLDPSDPYFHPRHLDLDRYHFDEAYHNGDVWVWLTGPVVSALVKQGRVAEAWRQTLVLKEMMFEEGAAGTLPELRNGVAPESGENVAGAVSQAWSLAEFTRNYYQDYIGVVPDVMDGSLRVAPALPTDLTWAAATVRHGAGATKVLHEISEDGLSGSFTLDGSELDRPLNVLFSARVPLDADVRTGEVSAEGELRPGRSLRFLVAESGGRWSVSVEDAADDALEAE